MTFPWIDGSLELLASCIDDKMSASQTAAYISWIFDYPITRNSVIGFARRHSMRFNSCMVGKYARKPKLHLVASKKANAAWVRIGHEPKPIEPPFLGLEIWELGDRQCRYPQGDGPYTFCGNHTDLDSSWCSYHEHICFNRGVKNELHTAAHRGPLQNRAGRARCGAKGGAF